MANDRTPVQAPEPGLGTPPRNSDRSLDVLHTEVAKIQVDGEYTKKFLTDLQTDMRDLRDRMARLEVRVDHLPTKGHIVTVTVIALTLIGALVTIAPKLQALAGIAAPVGQTNH